LALELFDPLGALLRSLEMLPLPDKLQSLENTCKVMDLEILAPDINQKAHE